MDVRSLEKALQGKPAMYRSTCTALVRSGLISICFQAENPAIRLRWLTSRPNRFVWSLGRWRHVWPKVPWCVGRAEDAAALEGSCPWWKFAGLGLYRMMTWHSNIIIDRSSSKLNVPWIGTAERHMFQKLGLAKCPQKSLQCKDGGFSPTASLQRE